MSPILFYNIYYWRKIIFLLFPAAFMKTSKDGTRLPDNPDDHACEADVNNGIHCSLAGTYVTIFMSQYDVI